LLKLTAPTGLTGHPRMRRKTCLFADPFTGLSLIFTG
jgi:hypothetical protein